MLVKITRLLSITAIFNLLTNQCAQAEAFKNTSVGQILWAVFAAGFGIPAVIGFIIYWLTYAVAGRRSKLGFVVLAAVIGWWTGLFFFLSAFSGAAVLFIVILSAGAASLGAYLTIVPEMPADEE